MSLMGGATTDASAAGGRVAVSAGSGRGGALELVGGAGDDGASLTLTSSDSVQVGLVDLGAGSSIDSVSYGGPAL